jgi:Transposase DDE domain
MVFPEKTLFCGDAGFVGYKLWRGIMESSHSFLIRVGANVHLLKNLGQVRTNGNCVWVWPRDVMKRDMPPIQLRLITVQIGSKTMYLVTNVLSERNLSVKMIKQLYTLRWGIELHFRSTKQTFERGTLRSRNSDNSLAELDWSLIALTMIQLMAIREQTKIDVPPEHTSVAQALKAVRFAIYTRHVPLPKEQLLNRQLRLAVIDDYERLHSKRGRYHPNKKRKPSATKPILTQASKTQKSAYQQYKRAA